MSQVQKFDFLVAEPLKNGALRDGINRLYHADESELVKQLLSSVNLDAVSTRRVNKAACDLISHVRARKDEQGVLEAFMQQYDLSSEEGVVLMCLAEALLRIPDDETAEKLIVDKLAGADWEAHGFGYRPGDALADTKLVQISIIGSCRLRAATQVPENTKVGASRPR